MYHKNEILLKVLTVLNRVHHVRYRSVSCPISAWDWLLSWLPNIVDLRGPSISSTCGLMMSPMLIWSTNHSSASPVSWALSVSGCPWESSSSSICSLSNCSSSPVFDTWWLRALATPRIRSLNLVKPWSRWWMLSLVYSTLGSNLVLKRCLVSGRKAARLKHRSLFLLSWIGHRRCRFPAGLCDEGQSSRFEGQQRARETSGSWVYGMHYALISDKMIRRIGLTYNLKVFRLTMQFVLGLRIMTRT